MAGALTTLTTDASRGLLDATSKSVVVYHEVDFLADAANGAFNSYPIPSNVSGELQDIGIAIGSPAPNTVDVLITDGFGLTVYAQTGITALHLTQRRPHPAHCRLAEQRVPAHGPLHGRRTRSVSRRPTLEMANQPRTRLIPIQSMSPPSVTARPAVFPFGRKKAS